MVDTYYMLYRTIIIKINLPMHVNIAMVYLLLRFAISGLMYWSMCLRGGRTGDGNDSVGLCSPNSPFPEQSSVYLKNNDDFMCNRV